MVRNWVVLAGIGLLALVVAAPTVVSAQDDGPSTDVLSQRQAEPAEETESTSASPDKVESQPAPEQREMPPEIVEAMNAADKKFKKLRSELADKLMQMRTTHTLYMNGEDRTPQAKDSYRQQRNEARQLLNQTFDAALDLVRYRADDAAATYLVTMIQHRFNHDIYDVPTLEAGARLIDGGVRFVYLYLSTARSAMALGDFQLARKVYESISPDELEDVDKSLIMRAQMIEEQWNKESAIREKEAKEDRLPRVKLVTTRGEVLLELYIDQAPSTAANFIKLVEDGYYDGLDFYQVVDHMLALTGDETGDGSGNTGKFLKDEHEREDARSPLRGSLVMAKIPVGETSEFIPNSASAQFAILYLPIPQVSETQTVFGRVIEGMDAIGALRRVDPTKKKKKGEVLMPPDRILSAEVVRRPDELPEIVYGQPGVTAQAHDHQHDHQ